MSTKSTTPSLIAGSVVIPAKPVRSTTSADDGKATGKQARKPYNQLKAAEAKAKAITAEKKAAKKSGRKKDPLTGIKPTKVGLKISKAELKVRQRTQQVKAAKAGKETANGKSGICTVCGKPLSKHTSVTNGMGDICAVKVKLLPPGVTMQDHYANLTLVDEPGSDYMPLKEMIAEAKKKGVSTYAVLIAIGGDRMLREPISNHFRIVIHKNRRYIPKSSLKNLALLKQKA